MGKPKTIKLEMPQAAVDDANADDDLEDLSPEERDALKAVLEVEGAQDARWKVFRLPPLAPGKAAGFCDTLTSTELTLEELRARFGRGKYRIQGTRSNGTFIKQVTLEIASDAANAEVKTQARESNSEVLAMLESMRERDAERSAKTQQLMLAAIPVLGGIIQGMISNKGTDPLTMLAALKNLQPPAPDTSGLILKLLDAVGSDKETNVLDLVKEGIKEIVPALANLKQSAPAQLPTPTPQLIAPNPTAPTPSASPTEDDPEMLQTLRLATWAKNTLANLIQKAAQGRDPVLYADVTLDNIPEGIDARAFATYLTRDNWWQVLQQFCPEVAPYQPWFSEFRDAMIEGYEEATGERLRPRAPIPATDEGDGIEHDTPNGA